LNYVKSLNRTSNAGSQIQIFLTLFTGFRKSVKDFTGFRKPVKKFTEFQNMREFYRLKVKRFGGVL